jgi:tetratricopeptide (TPR) repeat protein/uncharacterized membrane protein YgcG
MKSSRKQIPSWILLCLFSVVIFFLFGITQFAQTKLPAPTGHVNDFAGVVNESTRQQLENVLANLKLKTGIDFEIAAVQSTSGQDISKFSLQLARDWNVCARTSTKKTLLLVLAVDEKDSLTCISKSVQPDLPEGVLAEMGHRMRASIEAGHFGEGLNAGVQHFINALSQKLAFSTEDLDKAPQEATAKSLPTAEPNTTRPPVQADPNNTSASIDVLPATVKTPAVRTGSATRNRKAVAAPVDDEAEAEQVELTLTKPLEERITLLKAFLDSHPDSKSRARATELLVSARARLGDERLKRSDSAGGVEQLMQAVADAPVDASDKLFAGVIAQIPLNLYLRGEPAAASKAAQNIEAKFGKDAQRLVALSSFYLTTEQGSEATRLATQAVQLAPDLAAAHEALGLGLQVSLHLEEAALEHKKALELDPTSKAARRSVADFDRAFGKSEEALTLYRQQLEADPADKVARAGLVLSLLELGRVDEAKGELKKAIDQDPRNVTLLAGAAYWFVAHGDSEYALGLANNAVMLEPRYTWSQIALARSLVGQRRPLDAERAIRFARQYGKFPTLDYELASTLLAAGLYEEAAEVLKQSFSIKDGQIETRLAGQTVAHASSFIELLGPERRGSIFQSTAADTESNANLLKALLTFATAIDPEANGGTINEENAVLAAKQFASGDDAARAHRELYAASRLLQKRIGFQTAYELAEASRSSAEIGMTVPDVTVVVQADELGPIRARAIAAGGTPNIPEAPRNVLSNLLRGRIEDTSGWALLNQNKVDEAVEHLKRAVNILPGGTPSARDSMWHLAVALDQQGNKTEALAYYIKSYNAGLPDPVRRAVIEQLYRKVNGSLDGIENQIGAGFEATNTPTPSTEKPAETVPPTSSPEATPAPSPEVTSAQGSHSALVPATVPAATPVETPTAATPEPTPTQSPESTPVPAPAATLPTPDAGSTPAPATATPGPSPTPDPGPVEKMNKPPQTTVAIGGRVKDASGNPLPNVVVVLISPQGTVLASTTDEQGNYSFTVAASSTTRSYRVIPSKDGWAFEPVDRLLPVAGDDMKELDFVAGPVKQTAGLQ